MPSQGADLGVFFRQCVKENFSYFPNSALAHYFTSWTESALEKRLKDQTGLLICAWQNTEIVGLVAGSLPEGGVGTIMWLMVAKKHQNKSLGKQLLTAGKNFYVAKDAHKIKLTVHDQDAVRFYKREGFIQEAFHPNHWWGLDFWEMALFI